VYKNYLKNNPNCPCCKELSINRVRIRNSQLKRLEEEKIIWYADGPLNGGIKELYKSGHFSWACDDCIECNRAIEAKFEDQTYCDYPPYLAYFDKEMDCKKCGQSFTFVKEEQHYWYEVLKFWVQSIPKNCKKCRAIIKQEKDLNIKLSNLLKKLNLNNPKELIEVSQLYFEMNKVEKGKYYASLARKAMHLSIKNEN
jgi:hypothetical protein